MNNLFYIYFIFVNFFIFLTTVPTKQTSIKAKTNVKKVNNTNVKKTNNNASKNKKNIPKNKQKVGTKKQNNQKNIKKAGTIKKVGKSKGGGGGGNSGVQATSASNIPSNQAENGILTQEEIKFLQDIGIKETKDLSVLNTQLNEKNKLIMAELETKENELKANPNKDEEIKNRVGALIKQDESISNIMSKIVEYTNKTNENN